MTNDDPAKAKRAEMLFKNAVDGKALLRTSLLVIAEIVWTLESFYGLEKEDIAEKIAIILNTPNLSCPEARSIRPAMHLYVDQNIDFIDAYHSFYMKDAMKDAQLSEIVTYDRKHFGRVNWLRIVEP